MTAYNKGGLMGFYVALVILCGYLVFNFFSKKVIVYDYEKGLLYKKGKFIKVLGAGLYRVFRATTTINKVDIRTRFITIPGQEVLSADGITLKVTLAAQYEISNPEIALTKTQDYQGTLYLMLQLALRDIVGSLPIDEVLQKRKEFSKGLMEQTQEKAKAIGINLMMADIKDIMFPGELKNVFAQEVKARKEGLASLEKARGETAALRNLANAAKLLEDNPALLQLRMLQSTGNTFVIGTQTPVEVLSKDKEKSKEN
jgi:regulator of protease activity HflC (stomatin/prohibitin superfamily)